MQLVGTVFCIDSVELIIPICHTCREPERFKMPITKDQKAQQVADLTELLNSSKLTVYAQYTGTGVKQMQSLRKDAKESNTSIKVVKNRLVKVALKQSDRLAEVDSKALTGQLLYAFNAEDEVTPAQVLHNFAKDNPSLDILGAIDSEGNLLTEEEAKHLATLPSKDQLRGQLVSVIAAPMSGFVSVLNGNLSGLVNVLNARKDAIA